MRTHLEDYRRAVVAAGGRFDDPPPATPEDARAAESLLGHELVGAIEVLYQRHNGTERVFPGGFFMTRLPSTIEEALDTAACAFGAPFGIRDHYPLFRADSSVFTVVLVGDHQGEVWFYEVAPDENNIVPVASSLEELFRGWTELLDDGVLYVDDRNWVVLGEEQRSIDALLEYLPEINPLSVSPEQMVAMEPDRFLRPRQRAAGVHQAVWDDEMDEFELFQEATAEQQRILASFSDDR